MFFECDGNLSFGTGDEILCDSSMTTYTSNELAALVKSELQADFLSASDFYEIWGGILLVFVIAFTFKMMRKSLGS
jgi:hypothetical protein